VSPALRSLRSGIVLALAVLALDQASKFYLLDVMGLGQSGPIKVLPFLDLSFVWNRGISYGLFQQGSAAGRWALVILELAAVALILVWMSRTRSQITGMALGLIAGGALGNAFDRALYGAVIDFLHLHAGHWRWLDFPYLFNLADTAISLGVVLLILESLLARREALEARGDSG